MPYKDLEKRRLWRREYRKKHPESRGNQSKEKKAAYAREYRKTYDKTLKGFLIRRYNAMRCRVSGGLARSSLKLYGKVKAKKYEGMCLLTKVEFMNWGLVHPEYLKLHSDWVASNYSIKKTPTVDRVDNDGGYELTNMRWLTFGENSLLGVLSTVGPSGYRGVSFEKGCKKKWAASIVKNGKQFRIGHFDTKEEAAKAYDRWARIIYGRAINFPDS